VPPPATLAYEYWDGSGWDPLGRDLDETWSLLRTGRMIVTVPANRAQKRTLGVVTTSLYWLRVRLVEQHFDRVPRLAQVLSNTTTAIQAVTITDEVLGGSDGMPDQGPFTLTTTPVVPWEEPYTVHRADGTPIKVVSLLLEIDEGSGFEPWQEVDDFLASKPDDPHYVLDRAAGEVTFGDGRLARIPVANPANTSGSIVARRYLAGGSARGNVGAGTVTVNYDGVNKWRTEIGDGAFVGSGSMLVAPVKVGADANTGAGSTITKDAPPGKLTLARAKQVTIDGWKRPQKKS
jgi:hypothetical protein